MYKSIDLNKEYKTKAEMIADVYKNKDKIIAFKKSIIYKSIDKGQLSSEGLITREVSKGIPTKEDYIYPVINTTNFVDSHLDNHQKGIWTKSIQEKQGKIRYSLDHSTKVADVIAYPKDVKIKAVDTTFKDLGYEYEQETQALVFEIRKDVIDNETALKVINKKLPVQNSVSMRYVKIDLAVDSEDKQYQAEKKEWDKIYSTVANKDFADENGIMWIVKEAEIVNESSMVTLGSNSATRMMYGNSGAAKTGTPDPIEQPLEDTAKVNDFINLLKS